MQKKSKKKKKNDTFDAYRYAGDFEKLSLQIVKIIYKDSLMTQNWYIVTRHRPREIMELMHI